MKKLVSSLLLTVACLSLNAQEAAVRLIAENPDRAANNMHSYEFHPIVDTKAPKGFKPFYISHYGRHGSRYEQNSTFARAAMDGFHHLDSLGLLTEAGKALYADVDAVVEAHKGMEGSLTPRGAREHQTLATRMAQRFPDVFKNKDRWEVNSFSSTNFRCIVSMCNFTNKLKELSPRQEFTYTSAERFMRYINPSLRVPRPGERPAQRPSFSPEQMARMRASQENQKFSPAPGTPGYDFTRFLTPLFKDYDAALKELGNPESFVRAIYSAGGLCQDIDFLGLDIYRKYFTPEELVYFWASGNDSIYRMRGGVLTQLTRDHTVGNELGRALSENAAARAADLQSRRNPLTHILTRAIGTELRARPDLAEIDVKRGDKFLLCSDGVHDMLDDVEIAPLLKGASDPAAAVSSLSAAVRNAGAADNFTMICVFA